MKLHIGCGKSYMPGWTNTDIANVKKDMYLDARKPIPLKDNSVKFIFSEHFIEHITNEEGKQLLSECNRVLSGTLRMSTPDLALIAQRYVDGDFTLPPFLKAFRTRTNCEMINQAFYSWGHRFLYDKDYLFDTLKTAGFKNVYECKWRVSNHPDLCGLETRQYCSEIIVEASNI